VIARTPRTVLMMVRPPVAFVLLLFAAVGMAQAGRPESVHPLFTVVALVIAGWFVNATALNDLSDERIDRVNLGNARGRPLVSGHATRSQLLAIGAGAGAVSLAVASAVSWRLGAVVAIGLVFNAAYSLPPIRLAGRGGVAPALLPLGFVVLPFVVGAMSVGHDLRRQDLLLLAGLYVTFVGRIILKDFRDVDGDRLYAKRTFLLTHGPTVTCQVSNAEHLRVLTGASEDVAAARPQLPLSAHSTIVRFGSHNGGVRSGRTPIAL